MFNRKQNRIADLEARLRVALTNRQPVDDGSHEKIRALQHQLGTTKQALRTTETQLGESRAQVATLIARLGEYADRGIANGQQAARYRAAWKSARRRAEAYGEGILRHVEERNTCLGWLKQEQEATAYLRGALANAERNSPAAAREGAAS